MLGGGRRQAGILAACGIVAMKNQVDRLIQDHALAARLASELAQIPDIETEPQGANTNMVFIKVEHKHRAPLQSFLKEEGILIGGRPPTFRLVLHRDITENDVNKTVSSIAKFFRELSY